MINTSKAIMFFVLLFIAQSTFSRGEAILFDRAELIAFSDDGNVMGYYNAQDKKRSCIFLFTQAGAEIEGQPQPPYSETKILTFLPGGADLGYTGRDRSFDIPGALYRRNETWFIHTDIGQAGCENALGAFTPYTLGKVGGEMFTVESKVRAIGIRLIRRKSYFHDLRNGGFIARKGYVSKWDGVVVIQTRDQFSYVRFVDSHANTSGLGRVTTGWLRSGDLVNPFPPVNKK
jgi:hypothetical protein